LLTTCLPVINSSINGCEEFEILLILFFLKLHDFSVFVTNSCIDIVILYRLTLLPLDVLSLDMLTYTMLSLVTCLISPSSYATT